MATWLKIVLHSELRFGDTMGLVAIPLGDLLPNLASVMTWTHFGNKFQNRPILLINCLKLPILEKNSKSLSSQWKDLTDHRSLLHFDAHSVFGKNTITSKQSLTHGSKFVKAVDQFLQIWSAQNASTLVIKFSLGNQYASHIDAWIANVIRKEVETLDLDFSSSTSPMKKEYVFPCRLMYTETGSCLKHLRLQYCDLKSVSDVCTSWLTKLTSIELTYVSLRLNDVECIMPSTLNLESLSIIYCGFVRYLFVRHRTLKKLVIENFCWLVELSCPNLEIFEYSGRNNLVFSHTPSLREASLHLHGLADCSSVFSNLASNAPQLQTLSLRVTSEPEVPPLPPRVTMSCLKRLDLVTHIPRGFDLFSITHLLYACPVLEALHLKVNPKTYLIKHTRRIYQDRPHFHLKEAKMDGLTIGLSMLKLVEYLLKNGVSLEQMVLVVGAKHTSFVTSTSKFITMQNINPNVKLIAI